YRRLSRSRRSASLEGGVAGAAVLEEGADGVPQVLGGEELAGFGPHRLVSGRDSAFAEAAEDVLGHRVRPGRAIGQLLRELARRGVEVVGLEEEVDDSPSLHPL